MGERGSFRDGPAESEFQLLTKGSIPVSDKFLPENLLFKLLSLIMVNEEFISITDTLQVHADQDAPDTLSISIKNKISVD